MGSVKLGLVTDIHGDHVSLAIALAHLRGLGVAAIWCAGDMIDGEPFGEETIAILRAENVTCIRGNHERWKLDGVSAEAEAFGTGEELSREALAWMRKLSKRHAAEFAGVRVAMIHGDIEDVTAETGAKKLRALLAELRADVLVCGHIHDAFEARVAEGLVVNPGACCRLGQIFVRKRRARRMLRAQGPGCVPEASGSWLSGSPRTPTFGVIDLPSLRFEVFGMDAGKVFPFDTYRRVT